MKSFSLSLSVNGSKKVRYGRSDAARLLAILAGLGDDCSEACKNLRQSIGEGLTTSDPRPLSPKLRALATALGLKEKE